MPNPNRRERILKAFGYFDLNYERAGDTDSIVAYIDQEVEDAEKKSFEEGFKQGREFGANETITKTMKDKECCKDCLVDEILSGPLDNSEVVPLNPPICFNALCKCHQAQPEDPMEDVVKAIDEGVKNWKWDAQPVSEWEKHVDMQLDEYASYQADGDTYPLNKAIKSLIQSILTQERAKLKEKVEGMKKELSLISSVENEEEFKKDLVRNGYNHALSDVLAELE